MAQTFTDREDSTHDDAERVVLGAVMLQPGLLGTVARLVTVADFYRPSHATIFAAITANAADSKPVDRIAVALSLKAVGELGRIGGAGYLSTCADAVPTVLNAPWYAQQVADRAYIRRTEEATLRVQQAAASGDRESVTAALEWMRASLAPPASSEPKNKTLDWSTFLTESFEDVQWLPGRLAAAGQQIALVGSGKAGKSLFALEWAWRMSAGLPFLGDAARAPLRVLYVDMENSQEDIQSRLRSLGATREELANLDYLSFPALRPLDTAPGAADLFEAVDAYRPQMIFFDTISRMIEGEENPSEAWLKMYRLAMMPLKARRIATCRLDHFGKDESKGSRGSSAKTQDVDQVWELSGGSDGLLLNRTYTRTGVGEDRFAIRRMCEKSGDQWKSGATRHVLAADEHGAAESGWIGASAIAQQLDAWGIPIDWSRERVRKEMKDRSLVLKAGNELLGDAIRYRRSGDRLLGG